MITLTGESSYEVYKSLFALEVETVFKVESDFETVMRRIEEYTPKDKLFEVFPINPGTSLYTMYGPDHCIITKNEVVAM